VTDSSSFVPVEEVILGGGPPPPTSTEAGAEAQRVQRLANGVRGLRTRSGGAQRVLMIIGGVLIPLGLIAVVLGWWGASRTPYLFEQVPYLISGGLLGIGLVFLGGFLYFTHWLTELVREHRAQSTAVVEAVNRLEALLAQSLSGVSSNGHSAAPATVADDVVLVATGKGSMAHRPECVVVAGKTGLRRVSAADGLEPCKLCDPYAA
jgi:hypothetical protein